MSNEKEMQEMKQSLRKLEEQVEQLKSQSKGSRSGLARFGIGFLIVFVGLILFIGVFQFISSD
ncbi:OadG family protein [Paenibacillus sinopodophylli]|uniref:OadG family protein n=1 Tax=Paenibacillus sinopodophylli TaxID=1837342 RepID=UPI00110CDE18|nr:OadG family protein [Paenibacillus sinopodophylli]